MLNFKEEMVQLTLEQIDRLPKGTTVLTTSVNCLPRTTLQKAKLALSDFGIPCFLSKNLAEEQGLIDLYLVFCLEN